MAIRSRERSAVPTLAWLIAGAGAVVPWLSGAAVKVFLDMMGQPTWPWSAFLNPWQLLFLLPITVWISLPFFVLAYAAYRLLPRDFAGLTTRRSRQLFFVGGLVLGVIGAAVVFVDMFWLFSFEELLLPVWAGYLPYMLAGLGIGYLAGRWACHGPPAAHA